MPFHCKLLFDISLPWNLRLLTLWTSSRKRRTFAFPSRSRKRSSSKREELEEKEWWSSRRNDVFSSKSKASLQLLSWTRRRTLFEEGIVIEESLYRVAIVSCNTGHECNGIRNGEETERNNHFERNDLRFGVKVWLHGIDRESLFHWLLQLKAKQTLR